MKRIAILIALALTGCSSTPPETITYLLRPDAPAGVTSVDRGARVALGRISTAAYLDRVGIVLEDRNHRITVARNHRWAEPLSESLRRMLQVEIGRAAGFGVGNEPVSGSRQEILIDIQIHQFHGSFSGAAKLIANWRLRRAKSNEIIKSYAFSRQAALRADGYDILVQTQIDLLVELAVAIADSLKEERAKSNVGSTSER